MTHWRVVLLLLLLAWPSAANASRGVPVPAYTPDELDDVRRWETVWVGRRIDKHTVDAVASFLPEPVVRIYKNPHTWGAPPQGFSFTIVPYRPAAETTGMRRATRQYAPQARLAADGSLKNYAAVAGIPFPRPGSGIEAAWNFDCNTHGDACFYNRLGTNINPRSRSEKTGDQDAWELFWIHRVDVPPLPALPDNPKGISRSTFYHMYSPPEFKDTRLLNLRYIDSSRGEDAYMWLDAFRRIQRISNADRTDTIDGTDLIYDDEYGWNGQILRNTYTLQGHRELLCARHLDIGRTSRQKGQALLNGISRERLQTLVVEVHSRDPHYLYGKRIWYLDPETFLIMWTEMYDRRMRYWKCFENLTNDVPTAGGGRKNFIVGAHYLDVQRTHAGIWQNRRIEVGTELSTDTFSLYNLQRGR